ncbi:ABC transporter substrate-binding protein [Aeromicrobium alkaliterrae]|uniref:ABC transporter substrate-binding protein n=1 Tax=Aeromicrobium alkaliterrae TaxID=302168 RepID=A0ABN2K016_9ACTN
MKRLAAVAVAATLVLAACSGGDDSSSSGDGTTVKIGLVGPETGAAPQFYTDLVRPTELAVKELSEKYGVDVEIVTADDQGTPDGASIAVQRLLNNEDVDVIFGPPQSGNALQVSEVIQRTGRPVFSPALADEIIENGADPNWAFRTNYSNTDLSTVVTELLFSGGGTVGVIHSADGYGQSGAETIEAQAEAAGYDVAAVEAIQPGATDFGPGIARLRAAGVDTVFLAITSGSDTATVTRAMAQENLGAKLVVTNATILADFSELADPAQWENLVFVDTRDLTGSSITAISEEYEAEYGEPPILPTNVHSVYAAVDAYLQAVSEVGDARDFDAIREAIEGLEEITVKDDVYPNPFSKDDHELYDPEEASGWFVLGFDASGTLENRGTLADFVS